MLQPNAMLEDVMVAAIGAVKKTLDISIFALRSTRIAEAIADAKERGVTVRVIIDKSQHDSEAFGVYTQWLAAKGIEVRILAGPDPNAEFQLAQKNHHKIAIFDGKVVETGSPNYTKYAARNNFENGHFLDDKTDVAAYQFIFEHMWKIAASYVPPAVTPALPTDEELTREVEKDPTPIEWPQRPQRPQLPAAKELKFNGETFPSSALLPEVPILPLLRKAIQSSKKSIRLAIYEFNLEEMLEDLRAAKKRGVKIEIVLDRSHVYTTGKGPDKMTPRKPTEEIVALIQEGFDVLLLKGERSGIMHNKIGVFDDKLSMGGSFNFTRQSEENHYENMTFSVDKAEIKDVVAYFKYMRGLAEEVDHEKLDEILSRSASFEAVEPEAGGRSKSTETGERESKFPPPPESAAAPVEFNGISLKRYYFSPQGGIEQALVAAIRAAKTSVDIAMFSFYSRNIADALLEAKNRGVAVRLVLDQSQAGLAKLDNWFSFHGFEMVLLAGPNEPWEEIADPKYEKMHHKFMVVDGKLLFNGSFNYSPNAEDNSFEHVRLIEEPLDIARFIESFVRMLARGFKPKPPKEEPTWDTKSLDPEQLFGAE
jgi:phosphatidylserine/phosphatidylglycerophosphate/cardiolipin synthase-like enzyme